MIVYNRRSKKKWSIEGRGVWLISGDDRHFATFEKLIKNYVFEEEQIVPYDINTGMSLLGKYIRPKLDSKERYEVIEVSDDGLLIDFWVSWDNVFRNWLHDDMSPCGVYIRPYTESDKFLVNTCIIDKRNGKEWDILGVHTEGVLAVEERVTKLLKYEELAEHYKHVDGGRCCTTLK